MSALPDRLVDDLLTWRTAATEGAQMIVDLEDWPASQLGVDSAAPAESASVVLAEERRHGA